MTGRLLTTRDVAEHLGVSPETVLRRWRSGELPGFRLASNVLRFDPAEIEAWLAGRHHGPNDSSPMLTAADGRGTVATVNNSDETRRG